MPLDEQTSGTTETTTTTTNTTNAAAGQNSPASTDIEALGLQITDIIQDVVKAFVTGKTTDGEDVFVENANFAKLADSAKTIIKINEDAEGKISKTTVNYEYIISEVVKLIQDAKVDGKKLENGTIDNTLVIASLRPALDALANKIKGDILGSTKDDLDTFEEVRKILQNSEGGLTSLIQSMSTATLNAETNAKTYTDSAIDKYDNNKVKNTRETVASHEKYIDETAKPTFDDHGKRIAANQTEIGKTNGSLTAAIAETTRINGEFVKFEANRLSENQKHIDEIIKLKADQVAEITKLKADQVAEITKLKATQVAEIKAIKEAQAKEFRDATTKINETVKISFKK